MNILKDMQSIFSNSMIYGAQKSAHFFTQIIALTQQ